MRLPENEKSSNFIDDTGNSVQYNRLKHRVSVEEAAIMQKHGWGYEDILVLRKLKEVSKGLSRLPDRDYPRGWEVELDPETRLPRSK